MLNLHGEVLESLAPEGTTLEEAFLPTLKKLHERFPKLRIVVRLTRLRSRVLGNTTNTLDYSLSTAPPLRRLRP